MTEEEVKKQEKRIEKFNKYNKELQPYKKVANFINPDAVSNGITYSISVTYGGDLYIGCHKNKDCLASTSIPYSEDLMKQLGEIIEPLITAKIKELEDKIDKI